MKPLSKSYFLGVFFIAMSTLMLEILLTRIFSVVMWYHFAFLAISIAMFGLTAGAIIVYLFPKQFPNKKIILRTAQSTILFSITTIITLLIYIKIPSEVNFRSANILFLTITYILFAIPFIFSGISICLALTKFPKRVNTLYASDLIGAGLGCLTVIFILKFTDGPTAIIFTALLAAIASLCFIFNTNYKIKKAILIFVSLLTIITLILVLFAHAHKPLIRFNNYKGSPFRESEFERWNTYAHIYAQGPLTTPRQPFMWCGPVPKDTPHLPHIKLKIEGYGFTTITKFDNLESLQYLKNDVINLAHYLKKDADVLIIGSGGGRDILSALVFNQSKITGIELNEDIIEAITKEFADYAGNLHTHPKVNIIEAEGRNYLTTNPKKYDIIQLINVHTWAATTAGAYTLTENSLYTLEAWDLFLNRLNDNGIITLTMWYIPKNPGEVYRMVSLASEALRQKGIENPIDNIMVSRCNQGGRGLAAMIVSKTPFSENDVNKLHNVSDHLRFSVDLSPYNIRTDLGDIARKEFTQPVAWDYPLNIEPPTDDKPYFFNLLKISDIVNWKPWINAHQKSKRFLDFNLEAVFILILLFGVVLLLTIMCILIPLIIKLRTIKPSLASICFFASIGLGFMLIEISQIQRLILFLGHPTYSLSVVLFSLLIAGGIGSYLTQDVKSKSIKARNLFLGLLGVILLIGLIIPSIISAFIGTSIFTKIMLSLLIMSSLGFFMGIAFPLGIKLNRNNKSELPWYWGINGATSITSSILAIIIAMTYGISKAYWTGFGFYILAAICYIAVMRKK
tara:strand:- start:1165 stop:3549 length:2385 start_codon:yes stop_codon:yes gene_type:complete